MNHAYAHNREVPARLLDPKVLASLSNLELVAKVVVEGFVIGLHRSPKFGFSQEFAEYRPYVEGDDPRYIDWNVFARTNHAYVKRFIGETNCHLMLMLDASASMGFASTGVAKLQYGKFLAASLAHLASTQHDAAGVIVFNDEVVDYRAPSSKSGALPGVIHALDRAEAAEGTELDKPFSRFRERVKKRGLVALISDFYCDPEALMESASPLAVQGQDIILFHLLDPGELKPKIPASTLYEDMETGHAIEVSPIFMGKQYRERVQRHVAAIKESAERAGADHILINTQEPLDRALHDYLIFREKRG